MTVTARVALLPIVIMAPCSGTRALAQTVKVYTPGVGIDNPVKMKYNQLRACWLLLLLLPPLLLLAWRVVTAFPSTL